MGVVMLAGIALSNSILIVEFAHHLLKEDRSIREAITISCRVRLPMALKLGEGSEAYTPHSVLNLLADFIGFVPRPKQSHQRPGNGQCIQSDRLK